ncbi:hypothetical protein D915_000970 [Fasciola hepatica]|uniref:BPTI/Kunitz inhibitor domain-containing protein n=1 Tax=Fasciola hepatica TaxID=6192 RepID=A0A4E0S3V4_FASHE|nr:hypothetical protein D915_000970 [Fasciola hepatica]
MHTLQVAIVSILVITIFSINAILRQEITPHEARDPGPCKDKKIRRSCGQIKKRCTSSACGGCQETKNNYQTMKNCNLKCKCKQPIAAGECNSDRPSHGWDGVKHDCVSLPRKGCGGNSNRHRTRARCMATCKWR